MRKKLIVFLVHNRVKMLRQAVKSVTYDHGYDMVIWDNASTEPEAVTALNELEASGYRVIRTGNDTFWNQAVNAIHAQFFGEEQYDYIVIMSDTSILVKGALEEMERVIYLRDDFGIVGPAYSSGHRNPQGPFMRWPQTFDDVELNSEFAAACRAGDGIEAAKHFVCTDPLEWETLPEADWSVGASKRELWEKIGGPDVTFAIGGCPIEFSHLARLAGFHTVCARHAFYYHWDHHYWEGWTVEEHTRWTDHQTWFGHVFGILNERYGGVDEAYRIFNASWQYMSSRWSMPPTPPE